MSIVHDGDNKSAPKKTQSNTRARQVTPKPQSRVAVNPSSLTARGVTRHIVGECVGQLTNEINKIIEHVKGQYELKVIPMDGETYSLHYAIVLLTATASVAGDKSTAVYTFILEGSNIQPEVAPITTNRGQQIEVTLTAMDAWEETTWSKIEDAVQREVGHDNIQSAGVMVIPSEVNFEDQTMVQGLAWAAHEAIHSEFETRYPEHFAHINIEDYVAKTDRIAVSAEFHQGHAEQITGTKIRSDVTLRVTSSTDAQTEDTYSAWQHRGVRRLLDISAYAELIYTGLDENHDSRRDRNQHMFVPQINVTQVMANKAMPNSPEAYFLGIATVMLLGESYQWAQVFNNYGQGSIHDIGGLGIRIMETLDPEVEPKLIETNGNTFGEKNLSKLVQEFISPTPVWTIDCEDAGPEQWITGPIVEAANGDESSEAWIVEVLDRLTGNRFSEYWDGQPLFENMNTRVHLGTYRNAEQEICDIRNIDLLAMLNMVGTTNPDVVAAWEDTYYNVGLPSELRLSERLQIIKRLLGSNQVKIRGFAERVVMTASFTEALVSAVVDAGLSVDQHGLRPLYGDNYQRGNRNILRYASSAHGTRMVRQRGRADTINGRRTFVPRRNR